MWTFLVIVALLDQNQAAPFTGENSSSSLVFILQQQQAQTTASAVPQQQISSSSSDSTSSSDTSESSQSSEGPQQLRERQNQENAAVEQMEFSQESVEVLQSPSNGTTSLWLDEMVALGQEAGHREEEQDTGDDSVESGRHRAMMLTFLPLLTQPRSKGSGLTPAASRTGETTTPGGAVLTTAAGTGEGGVTEEKPDTEFPRLLDVSTENADGLTFDLLDHNGYHGNEAGLELGL